MTALSGPPIVHPLRARLARGLEGLRQERLRSLVMIAAVAIVGWLVLYPLGILFEIGLRAEDGSLTLINYQRVLTEPGLVSALVNSIIISVAVTAFSFVLALPMAWAVARTDMVAAIVRVAVLIALWLPTSSQDRLILLLDPSPHQRLLRDVFGIASAFNIGSKMIGLRPDVQLLPLISSLHGRARHGPATRGGADVGRLGVARRRSSCPGPAGDPRRRCSCSWKPWGVRAPAAIATARAFIR
jgi:hypothetical protein